MKKTCEENQGMYFKIDTYQNVVASAATSCTLKPRRRTHSQLEFFSSKPIKNQNFYNQKQSVPNTKAYGYVKNEFSPTKHAIRFTVSIPNWKAKPIEGKEAQNFQLSENIGKA